MKRYFGIIGLVGLVGLALSARGQVKTPFYLSLREVTGATASRAVTIMPLDGPTEFGGTNIVYSPEMTLQPVSGAVATNLVMGNYRITFAGLTKAMDIFWPADPTITNAADPRLRTYGLVRTFTLYRTNGAAGGSVPEGVVTLGGTNTFTGPNTFEEPIRGSSLVLSNVGFVRVDWPGVLRGGLLDTNWDINPNGSAFFGNDPNRRIIIGLHGELKASHLSITGTNNTDGVLFTGTNVATAKAKMSEDTGFSGSAPGLTNLDGAGIQSNSIPTAALSTNDQSALARAAVALLSFQGRTNPAVTLTSADVTGALGFVPWSSSVPVVRSIGGLGTSVVLAWDTYTITNVVTNYLVYYGVESRAYTNSVSAGTNTTVMVTNLVRGAVYYFAATAVDEFGQESGYSSEVLCAIPLLAVDGSSITAGTINSNAFDVGTAALLTLAGTPGTNGINGTNGLPGLNGTNGINGTNGLLGLNGTNGINGTNGLDGQGADLRTNAFNLFAGTNAFMGRLGLNFTNWGNHVYDPFSFVWERVPTTGQWNGMGANLAFGPNYHNAPSNPLFRDGIGIYSLGGPFYDGGYSQPPAPLELRGSEIHIVAVGNDGIDFYNSDTLTARFSPYGNLLLGAGNQQNNPLIKFGPTPGGLFATNWAHILRYLRVNDGIVVNSNSWNSTFPLDSDVFADGDVRLLSSNGVPIFQCKSNGVTVYYGPPTAGTNIYTTTNTVTVEARTNRFVALPIPATLRASGVIFDQQDTLFAGAYAGYSARLPSGSGFEDGYNWQVPREALIGTNVTMITEWATIMGGTGGDFAYLARLGYVTDAGAGGYSGVTPTFTAGSGTVITWTTNAFTIPTTNAVVWVKAGAGGTTTNQANILQVIVNVY